MNEPRLQRTLPNGAVETFRACDFVSREIAGGMYKLKCKRCAYSVEQHKPRRMRACGPPIQVDPPPAWWRKWLPKPGDVLAAAIYRTTGVTLESGGCKCKQRRTAMNNWGWLKCLKNLPTIAGWLREGWATVYRRPK